MAPVAAPVPAALPIVPVINFGRAAINFWAVAAMRGAFAIAPAVPAPGIIDMATVGITPETSSVPSAA